MKQVSVFLCRKLREGEIKLLTHLNLFFMQMGYQTTQGRSHQNRFPGLTASRQSTLMVRQHLLLYREVIETPQIVL
jgi:formate hydrogenlyase subunit 4